MTKRMLIDATHAEETRVVVLDGNRLEDFDVETATKKQLKGNIYLAKIVRVEPSLQAAFVEYGGGRHGFLAFGEIHPDYYQIPVADRQRLLAMQAQEAREEEEAEDAAAQAEAAAAPRHDEQPSPSRQFAAEPEAHAEPTDPDRADLDAASSGHDDGHALEPEPEGDHDAPAHDAEARAEHPPVETVETAPDVAEAHSPDTHDELAGHDDAPAHDEPHHDEPVGHAEPAVHEEPSAHDDAGPHDDAPPRPAQAALIPQEVRFGEEVFEPHLTEDHIPGAAFETETDERAEMPVHADIETIEDDPASADQPAPETIGGESDSSDSADAARERRSMRLLRNYRIQEVIRRRQIILVQVVKEERGTKGAALTTYISMAGRFCVLMPNSPRGGGISRKITSAADRRRLKEVTAELDLPQGMGLIVRTAGAARPKPEIKRDAEYLMRLWDDIREHTMKSVAPALIYEEASLIKRSIRDVYSRDVDEVLVDGEEGWRSAHDFMRMLMPGHAKKVQLWRPNGGAAPQPLFSKFAVEAQLDAMLSPTVQLKSGGYLVINQTEALVAIDVNSGRSTRERGIEETALRTNLEASDEVARQLRLRDLAGLIVIDYIDMESRKNNAMVERRLTEALKNDRARIQVGHISHFGLMEMSRQRLRPSLAETSFVACPHCSGSGLVRSVESAAVHVLRAIEDEGAKAKASLIMVHCANAIAMYLLNNKRDRLGEIEASYAMRVHFSADESLAPPDIRIDRLRAPLGDAERALIAPVLPAAPAFVAVDDDDEETADEVFDDAPVRHVARAEQVARPAPAARPTPASAAVGETAAESEESVRRRRRRRRRGGRRENGEAVQGGAVGVADGEAAEPATEEGSAPESFAESLLADSTDEAVLTPEAPSEHEGEIVAATAEPDGDQPSIDPTDLDENGMPRARRRGRRGGRRRRRDGSEEPAAEAAPPAPMAPSIPAYVGPTPADPFGGQTFDIFDMMDEVESRPVATVTPRAPAAHVPEPASEPVQGSLDVALHEPPPIETAPPLAPEIAAHSSNAPVATEAPPALPPEPVAEAPVGAFVEPEAHAEPVVEAAPEPASAPVIQPIVIGQDPAPAAAPKKGWWRR